MSKLKLIALTIPSLLVVATSSNSPVFADDGDTTLVKFVADQGEFGRFLQTVLDLDEEPGKNTPHATALLEGLATVPDLVKRCEELYEPYGVDKLAQAGRRKIRLRARTVAKTCELARRARAKSQPRGLGSTDTALRVLAVGGFANIATCTLPADPSSCLAENAVVSTSSAPASGMKQVHRQRPTNCRREPAGAFTTDRRTTSNSRRFPRT